MNLDVCRKQFISYVKQFDLKDKAILNKFHHTFRVMEYAMEIATSLKLNEEEIQIAGIIGLLHDIGRFEQAKKYHTFIDKNSINHGEYGVKILFEDGLIRKFINTDKYDKIIRIAILNHNKAEIEKGLTKEEILHAKIIRDADKTDIFYTLTIGDKKVIWEKEDLSNDIITDEIYKEFLEDKVIDYKKRQTSADILVSHFAHVYDFNFERSLQIIRENNYLEKLYNRFIFKNKETKDRFEKIYELAKEQLK